MQHGDHRYTKTQEKIISQACVYLCCDDTYLRILEVFFQKMVLILQR